MEHERTDLSLGQSAPSITSQTRAPTRDAIAGSSGLLAVVLNVLGVGLLWDVPHAYKVGHFHEWFIEAINASSASQWSAWSFTVGVLLLVPFAYGLRDRLPRAKKLSGMAFVFIALAGIMNAAGTLSPFVLLRHVLPHCLPEAQSCLPVAAALLGFTLSLDALFNLLFGVGMILAGFAMVSHALFGRWIGGLGIVAGFLSLPIVFQAHASIFATFLMIAGPLWLVWVSVVSVIVLRGDGRSAEVVSV